jgi:hypothetical protein
MMRGLIDLLFGEQRNVIRDTVEVFRPNAEAQAGREHGFSQAALAQFAAEFATQPKGRFDRFIDGLNRLPRPALAFGTLGLFISAMVNPIWFATRMQGIALVPDGGDCVILFRGAASGQRAGFSPLGGRQHARHP